MPSSNPAAYAGFPQHIPTSLLLTAIHPLSKRQAEVLFWISEGKRDREIATILEISPRTVEKHVQKILEKLGVETRTAASRWWIERCRAIERMTVPAAV